jgi:biopolymer transport protein ExbD
MSEINAQGGSKGKQRAKKQSTKIDMTPMVDLAFLLLTFFILTTTLAEQKAFDITLPVPNDKPEDVDKVNNAVTLILTDKDKIIYYDDEFKGVDTRMYKVDFKEIRNHLSEKNAPVIKKMNAMTKDFDKKYKENVKRLGGGQEAKDSLQKLLKANRSHIWKGEGVKENQGVFAIIKYDEKAKYRNIVDIIDEMSLLGIEGYAIVKDLTDPEKQIIELTFGKK